MAMVFATFVSFAASLAFWAFYPDHVFVRREIAHTPMYLLRGGAPAPRIR